MTEMDVRISRVWPEDVNICHVEYGVCHRVGERRFLLDDIPADSTGVEFGVYTGLFSAVLARDTKIRHITFVDPWWELWGEYFPSSWNAYSDYGSVTTRAAHELAERRISYSGLPNRSVVIGYSTQWLDVQPDHSLDWAYVDSSHTYEETLQVLNLLSRKLKHCGVIIGDDWHYPGVFRAVNDFVEGGDFCLDFGGVCRQWKLRREDMNDGFGN